MIYFERIEVVNLLSADVAHEIVKQYTAVCEKWYTLTERNNVLRNPTAYPTRPNLHSRNPTISTTR